MIDDSWYVRPLQVSDRTSAGGIVVRAQGSEPLVALAREKNYKGPVLPKGGVEPGEDLLSAARHEIAACGADPDGRSWVRHARRVNMDGWNELREVVSKRDIAFVLGAGLSYPSGFPSWKDFVRDLFDEVGLETEGYERLLARGVSLPALTGLAKEHCNSRDLCWPEVVRSCLYRRSGWNARDIARLRSSHEKKARSIDADPIAQRNPTLATLVDICGVNVGGARKGHPRVGAALTYNLDSLVQIYDRSVNGHPRLFRTIERSSSRRRPGKIPLYHLHGYLYPWSGDAKDEAGDMLVLTENDYHARTDDPYHFAMTIALWALREFSMIFVGCSMTDDLMRRALYRAKAEQERHGTEPSRDGWASERTLLPARDERAKHFAIMRLPQYDMHVPESARASERRMLEQSLSMLDVRTLWVDRYDEIPGRLRALRGWLDGV